MTWPTERMLDCPPSMYRAVASSGRRCSVLAADPSEADHALAEFLISLPAVVPPEIDAAPWLVRDPAIASSYVASTGAIIWED